MILHSLTANFGALENRTLELKPGLNVIEAPNESGKSTWCAFLRAMLYGVDSSQREKNGKKPDKVLYAPWNGTAMSGSMDITWQGRDITLRRTTKTANAPMREFSAVYTDTEQPVSGLLGTDAGEALTGVSRSVFENTAFIGPAGLGVTQDAELEKRITALFTAGEEDASFSQSAEKLRAWQRKCRYRTQGRLPDIERELREKENALSERERLQREIETLEENAEYAERCRETVKREMRSDREARRLAAASELKEKRAAVETARALSAEAERKVSEKQAALRAERWGGEEPKLAEKETAEAAEKAEALRRAAKETPRLPWLRWVLLFLGVALVAAGIVVAHLLFAPAVVCLLGAVIEFIKYGKQKTAAAAAEQAHRALLSEWGVRSPDKIRAQAADYAALWEETQVFATDADEKRRALQLAEREAQSAEQIAYRELTEDEREAERLQTAEQKVWEAREKLQRARGRLDTMEDAVVLQSAALALEEEHSRLSRRYDALELALDVLGEVDEEMRSQFSPALSRETAAIWQKLTDGRYSTVALSRELTATVGREGDTVPHEGAFLSRGASDQLYLSLRLALCERLLPEKERCPIVLDDALINFDDERMKYALDYLRTLSETRQILLFTCHGREKQYIESITT